MPRCDFPARQLPVTATGERPRAAPLHRTTSSPPPRAGAEGVKSRRLSSFPSLPCWPRRTRTAPALPSAWEHGDSCSHTPCSHSCRSTARVLAETKINDFALWICLKVPCSVSLSLFGAVLGDEVRVANAEGGAQRVPSEEHWGGSPWLGTGQEHAPSTPRHGNQLSPCLICHNSASQVHTGIVWH